MIFRKKKFTHQVFLALSLMICGGGIPQLKADATSKFEEEHKLRIENIQNSFKENNVKSVAIQQKQKVEKRLKDYQGSLGPNQKEAALVLASAKLEKEILNTLKAAAEEVGEGNDLIFKANQNLKSKLGVILVQDSQSNTWEVRVAGSNDTEKVENSKKFTSSVGAEFDSKMWSNIPDEKKKALGELGLDKINLELKNIIPSDGKIPSNFVQELAQKSDNLGDRETGKIKELKEDLVSAKKNDESEKRLLAAEKKTYENLEANPEKKSDDFCKDFATNVSQNTNGTFDLNKSLSSLSAENPCAKAIGEASKNQSDAAPLESRVGKEASEKKDSSASESTKGVKAERVSPILPGSAEETVEETAEEKPEEKPEEKAEEKAEEKPEENSDEGTTPDHNPSDTLDGGRKAKKKKSFFSKNEKDKLKKLDPKLASKIQKLEEQRKELMGALDARTRQDLINACNQAATNLTKSIGLGSDNEKNEKIVSSIADKLEKTLAKGYQGLVCDKSGASDGLATYSSMDEASKDVLKGLGIPPTGPLTQSKQNTLESLSKGAMEVAANFANQRRNRSRLDFQMLESASKKALTRIATENPNLMDANTLSYLRTLSYNELLGPTSGNPEVDMMNGGMGGGLLTKFLPSYALQTYQNYFDIALMDIKQKNGIREEFDKQAECALAFAQAATQRWADEEDRKGLLSLRARGSSASGLPVNNGPTVKNEESSRKVERNR